MQARSGQGVIKELEAKRAKIKRLIDYYIDA